MRRGPRKLNKLLTICISGALVLFFGPFYFQVPSPQTQDVDRRVLHEKYQKNKDTGPCDEEVKLCGKDSINEGAEDRGVGGGEVRNIDSRPLAVFKDGVIGNYEIFDPANRTGPGEYGEPVITADAEKIKAEMSAREYGFNLVNSDKIALDRALPDIRLKECRYWHYPENLPTASVIIVFHNEGWSTLLRTVHSVINTSPTRLLKEVILVDDDSDKEHLKQQLDLYVKRFEGLVKLYRNDEREGLIRSRIKGALLATGDVILFLDAHCECNKNWLPPLLTRIAHDRTIMAVPIIDGIDWTKYTYRSNYYGVHYRGIFEWSLFYKESLLPGQEEGRRNYKSEPYRLRLKCSREGSGDPGTVRPARLIISSGPSPPLHAAQTANGTSPRKRCLVEPTKNFPENMEAPQHCSLLHYPDCQKGCAPGGEPGHSPDLRQEVRRYQTKGTENNGEPDDRVLGMQPRHFKGEVRIFIMFLLNLANHIAVKRDRKFNDINKFIGFVKKDKIRSPTHAGGLFAMDRKYFFELGAYDPGLEVWGGENFELSFKIWQCGGSIEWVPCSRIGHIYKQYSVDRKIPLSYNIPFTKMNYMRVVEVWFDEEHKEHFYNLEPWLRGTPLKNLQPQLEFRRKHNCKSFKWFMDNVAYELLEMFPPPPKNIEWGQIRPWYTDQCWTQVREGKLMLIPCESRPYKELQFYRLDVRGRLTQGERCLLRTKDNAYPQISRCPDNPKGSWEYIKETQQIRNNAIHMCVQFNEKTNFLFFEKCDVNSNDQKWIFKQIYMWM